MIIACKGKFLRMTETYKFSQMIKDNLQNSFRYLGESKYGAVLVMCAIAVFKGIFRPIFTLMDKKSDPGAKKYAAMREGLTEVAALPLYALVPILAEKIVSKACKGKSNIETLEKNGRFIGLAAATLLIPAVCNVIQPPMMKAYKNYEDSKKAKVGNVNSITSVNKPLQTAFKGGFNRGMKVGG